MVDFLKEHPWCTPEDYKWKYNVAQIRLMSHDFTHIEYLDKDRVKGGLDVVNTADDLIKMMGGVPSINKPK